MQSESDAKTLQLLLLLPLLLLATSAAANAAAVHEVSVSIRSVKSLVYHGTQVSVFQHTQSPHRYFFQPLSFLDVAACRVSRDAELSRSRLHLPLLMWTEEFVRLVEASFPGAESVEMMPLTQIRLTWSQLAPEWLGADFNETYRLLGGWRDGDKPQMLTTFTVACSDDSSCQRLLRRLNGSAEAAGGMFELRYRVPFEDSRNMTLAVRSSHLLASVTFQQLQRFADTQPGLKRVLVTDETVDRLVEEAYTAAVSQVQSSTRQEVASVGTDARQSIRKRLQRQLRADPVGSPSLLQWSSQVFWRRDRRQLRPDRLARMFNAMFVAHERPLKVRLSPSAKAVVAEAKENLPKDAADTLAAFKRLHSKRRPSDAELAIDVADVRDLSLSLGSSVAWLPADQKFAPAPTAQLFRIDVASLRSRGILLLQEAVVSLRVSEHSDHVVPLGVGGRDGVGGGGGGDWRAEAAILQKQLEAQKLQLQRTASQAAKTARQLESWLATFAPAAPGGDVRQRSFGHGARSPDVAELLRNASASCQPRFAESFCILANRQNPTGMTCRTLSFWLPKKSLRNSMIFDRRVRYDGGVIGQNHFYRVNSNFFKFGLKICCK